MWCLIQFSQFSVVFFVYYFNFIPHGKVISVFPQITCSNRVINIPSCDSFTMLLSTYFEGAAGFPFVKAPQLHEMEYMSLLIFFSVDDFTQRLFLPSLVLNFNTILMLYGQQTFSTSSEIPFAQSRQTLVNLGVATFLLHNWIRLYVFLWGVGRCSLIYCCLSGSFHEGV